MGERLPRLAEDERVVVEAVKHALLHLGARDQVLALEDITRRRERVAKNSIVLNDHAIAGIGNKALPAKRKAVRK